MYIIHMHDASTTMCFVCVSFVWAGSGVIVFSIRVLFLRWGYVRLTLPPFRSKGPSSPKRQKTPSLPTSWPGRSWNRSWKSPVPGEGTWKNGGVLGVFGVFKIARLFESSMMADFWEIFFWRLQWLDVFPHFKWVLTNDLTGILELPVAWQTLLE